MAIQALEPEFELSILLQVAAMARSTYYYRISHLDTADKYKSLVARLIELHSLHKGRYGYRRLTAALRNEGFVINHKTVRKLMKRHGLECKIRKKKKRSMTASELGIVPNIINRDFKASAPFEKGVSDVTEFDVGKYRVYVSAILDLYDGAVISMVYSLHNDTELIMSMYEHISPIGQEHLYNMLIHTDQGALYRTVRYRDFLSSRNITQSMSRKGNCYDNAVMESFFGTFKSETIHLYRIDSIERLIQELQEYANYYNQYRLKSTLGYKSPFQYRKENGFEKFIYICKANNADGTVIPNQKTEPDIESGLSFANIASGNDYPIQST